MRTLLLGLTMAVALTLVAATPALACTGPMPAPGSGFGQCVSMMAHAAMMSGVSFGQCVSAMAHGICSCCGAITG